MAGDAPCFLRDSMWFNEIHRDLVVKLLTELEVQDRKGTKNVCVRRTSDTITDPIKILDRQQLPASCKRWPQAESKNAIIRTFNWSLFPQKIY